MAFGLALAGIKGFRKARKLWKRGKKARRRIRRALGTGQSVSQTMRTGSLTTSGGNTVRFQQPQTAAIGVGAVGALRGIASNPAVRRAIQQGGKAALGGAAAGAGATALADLAGIDTAFSKRKTNGSANGIADKLIDQLESDNPEAMQLLLTMAMGKKGAKVEIPIHGLFTEPIEYEGPDGKILFRSPKGYRLVWTPRGALSVWKPFALKMGFVKNPRKPLVTAGDIGTVRRAASVQKKIRNAAEKAGCVSTPRRRSSSKRKTSGRRRNAQGRFV